MNNKGLFYLFVSVIFLLTILLLFFLRESYSHSDSKQPITTRIKTMNDFIADLNNDMSKSSFIAAYRALIALEEEISFTGQYFVDAEPVFEEAFFNGTVNGQNKTILNASSFSDYLARVNVIANDLGMNLSISVKEIELYHTTPWKVAVRINFQNNLTDLKGLARWSYTKEIETEVPIRDLLDPVYSVGTQGRVPNPVRKTNVSYFVYDVDNANDTTNLMTHTNNSYYIANEMAPSYVMRLEGNFSNSTYGIESLVNINNLQLQGLSVDSTRSIVDYIYFDTNLTNASIVCTSIINTPSWFKIDEDHLQAYEIDPKLGPEGDGYIC